MTAVAIFHVPQPFTRATLPQEAITTSAILRVSINLMAVPTSAFNGLFNMSGYIMQHEIVAPAPMTFAAFCTVIQPVVTVFVSNSWPMMHTVRRRLRHR